MKKKRVIALQTGILSLFIPVSLAVLLASGWRREIAGDAPLPAVAAVLASAALGAGVKFKAADDFTVSADQTAYAFAALASFRNGGDRSSPFLTVIAAFPVAAVCHAPFTLGRLAVLLPLEPDVLASLAAGCIAALALSRPDRQFAALWLGLSAMELWRQQWTETLHVHLGGRGFADALWLSFLSARIFAGLFGFARGGASWFLARQK